MRKFVVLTALMLSACGIDGEPVQPDGGVNVSLGGNGVGLGANVGLRKGPLRVGLGL